MLELLLILAVMVFIVSKLEASHFEQVKEQWGFGKAQPAPGAADANAPRLRPRLAIEGTQRPGFANIRFVKGYGLNPQRLADLRIYAHFGRYDQFPDSIQRLLGELHDEGCAIGTNIMELMFHGRGLAEGEAIYFALVEGAREPHVVAFVDRLRTH